MDTQRRNFLKGSAALGAATILSGMGVGCSSAAGVKEEAKRLPIRDAKGINWKALRDNFPLSRDRAYMNNGGLGPSPYPVVEKIYQALIEHETTGEVGGYAMARPKLAEFFGVKASEIALTSNTTEGTNIVAWGVELSSGDEVLMSTHEHAGGSVPWLQRMKRDGIKVVTFEPAKTADENLNLINDAITERTRVISLSDVTCTTGLHFPVKAICTLARDKGILTYIDGAQSAGMMPLNLTELGCDFWATSGHKWMLGPKRTGFLYVREESMEYLTPVWVGVYSTTFFEFDGSIGYKEGADRFEYGTPNSPLNIGLMAAVDFLTEIGIADIWAKGRSMNRTLDSALREIKGIEVLSPTEEASATCMTTIKIDGVHYRKLYSVLKDEYNVRARAVGEANLDGIRISINATYNSQEEIDHIIGAVRAIASA